MFSAQWHKTRADSSIQHARYTRAVEEGGKAFVLVVATIVLVVLVSVSYAEEPGNNREISFNLPQQRADVSLTRFAAQADLTLMFPYDVVRVKTTNRLVGIYTPREAIELLLKGTGLRPTFSDEGYINIALEEAPVVEGDQMKDQTKKGILALLGAVFVGASANAQSDESAVLEEIIVKGFRSSINAALDQKRNSNVVSDSIVAHDIAAFPDLNISEALQRLPGVTISRLDGEGRQVSVRGLAPEFTRATVNGLTLVSTNAGREVDFDVFASELFSSVTLFKTPQASQTEGGLAATIDLRTPRPFNYGDDPVIAISAQGYYNDLTEEIDPRAAFLVSHKSADESFGALLSVAYSDRLLRGDKSEGFRYQQRSFDVDGDGITDFDNVFHSMLPRTQVETRDRSRLGVQGAIQIRPSDSIDFAIDVLYAEFEERRERYNIEAVLFGTPTASALTVDDGLVVAGTFENVPIWLEGLGSDIEDDLIHVNAEGNLRLNDIWTAKAKIGFSEADGVVDEARYVFQAVDQFSYELRGGMALISTPTDPLDPSTFFHSQTRLVPSSTSNEEASGQLDFHADIQKGAVENVSFGLRLSDREIDRKQWDARHRDRSIQLAAPVAAGLPVDNLLSGFGGRSETITDFLIADIAALREDSALLPTDLTPTLLVTNSFVVKEESVGGYVMADFETSLAGAPLAINAGVRVVRTDQSSIGTEVIDGVPNPVTIENSYTDTLPSANFRLEAAEDVVIRLALSRAMTRPTLFDLSARRNLQLTSRTGSFGNPELDPFRADQVDLSLEWYFAPESLIAVTAFHKDVESFIVDVLTQEPVFGDNLIDNLGNDVSGEIFTVTRPVNGTGGFVTGFEVSYQQPFGGPLEGFGVLANYTYADSEITVDIGGVPTKSQLPGQSENSYNLTAYYENGPFSGRLAYSWRDDYVWNVRAGSQFESAADFGQLDFAFRYDLNENFSLTLEGLNLTGEKSFLYDTVERRPMVLADTSRVFLFGARANF